MGDIYYLNQKFEIALKVFKKCHKHDKNDSKATAGLAMCYQELGQYDMAIKIYKTILKKKKSADLHYNLGNCYYITKQTMLAIEQFSLSLKLNSANSKCWFNLGNS